VEGAFRFGLGIVLALGTPALAFILIQAAMRKFGGSGRADDASSTEVRALRAEIDELRDLPPRIAELEERLDFAERMLSRQREAERVPGGPDAGR
jgi:hypothetical protein